MATIGETTRPAFAYDQATDTWVPVGIGPHSHTPSAVNSVSLDGGSTITVASGTTIPLTIQNNGTGNSFVVNDVASDTTPFAIMANGNVGVGTGTGPTTVSSGLAINDATAANYPGLEIQTAGTTRMYFNANNAASYIASVGTNPLATYTNGSERMRVDSSGNVGIGTASPTAALDVNGSIKSDNMQTGNPFLNSAFQVWQRGTSIACSTTAFVADRWNGYRAVAGATVSRQVTGDTTNLPNIQYAARVQRDSANTATNPIYIGQSFETINSIPFAGKTVTLSFYARAGANYSSASSALWVALFSGTGTDQNGTTGAYTGGSYRISTTATLTTTWQRFTFTGTIASTATELTTQFYFTPVGTAGAADYFDVTGVQIDVGNVALPFRTNGGTIQQELAACQRYYYRTGPGISGEIFAFGNAYSTTRVLGPAPVPVTMRVTPSAIEFSSLELNDFNAGYAVTALTIYSGGKNMPTIDARVASGLTANRFFNLIATGTSGYLAFSAEL
jgi:hypothetical protein